MPASRSRAVKRLHALGCLLDDPRGQPQVLLTALRSVLEAGVPMVSDRVAAGQSVGRLLYTSGLETSEAVALLDAALGPRPSGNTRKADAWGGRRVIAQQGARLADYFRQLRALLIDLRSVTGSTVSAARDRARVTDCIVRLFKNVGGEDFEVDSFARDALGSRPPGGGLVATEWDDLLAVAVHIAEQSSRLPFRCSF